MFSPLRYFRRKGYGVQSPFAYHVVRDIVAETTPFYAYAELRQHFGRRRDEPLLQLLLRLANDVQPDTVYIYTERDASSSDTAPLAAYLKAGCRRASIEVWQTESTPPPPRSARLVVAPDARAALALIDNIADDGCLVVFDTRAARAAYRELQTHPRATALFDLRTHALLFPRHSQPKAVYKV